MCDTSIATFSASLRVGTMIETDLATADMFDSMLLPPLSLNRIEGGITNGEEVRVVGYLKPIPTLKKALRSVDMISKEPFLAQHERSDTCTVPAAGVIGESMVALVLAGAFLEKFGGDSVPETARNYSAYIDQLRAY